MNLVLFRCLSASSRRTKVLSPGRDTDPERMTSEERRGRGGDIRVHFGTKSNCTGKGRDSNVVVGRNKPDESTVFIRVFHGLW